MVARQHYRWDFIGLSTDNKPTPTTSEKVVDGSTFYCSDNSKLYVWYKTQWYEKTVSGGGGGTSDFDQLTNRPMYNGVAMTSETNIPEVISYTAGDNITITNGEISATDTTYTDFTGTDGTAAGTAGLVPAPIATDAGYFLSASGDWEEVASGGGVVELTTADYNYPTNNPDGVALWTLDPGIYIRSSSVKVYLSTNRVVDTQYQEFIMTPAESSGAAPVMGIVYLNHANPIMYYAVVDTNGSEIYQPTAILTSRVISQSTGTFTDTVMSQNATTSMVFRNGDESKIQIGPSSAASGSNYPLAIGSDATASGFSDSIAIGHYATATANGAIAIGSGNTIVDTDTEARATGAIALGKGAKATQRGQMDIGSANDTSCGYNNSNYRLLTGLYDGQSAHDAATVGQITPTTDSSAPTTATVGRVGQFYIDTSTGSVYMCIAADSVTPAYTWKLIAS